MKTSTQTTKISYYLLERWLTFLSNMLTYSIQKNKCFIIHYDFYVSRSFETETKIIMHYNGPVIVTLGYFCLWKNISTFSF